MDFINVGGNNTGSVVPMGCMCASDYGYVTTRGDNNTCFHCGCSCKITGNNNKGNSRTAARCLNAPGSYILE